MPYESEILTYKQIKKRYFPEKKEPFKLSNLLYIDRITFLSLYIQFRDWFFIFFKIKKRYTLNNREYEMRLFWDKRGIYSKNGEARYWDVINTRT